MLCWGSDTCVKFPSNVVKTCRFWALLHGTAVTESSRRAAAGQAWSVSMLWGCRRASVLPACCCWGSGQQGAGQPTSIFCCSAPGAWQPAVQLRAAIARRSSALPQRPLMVPGEHSTVLCIKYSDCELWDQWVKECTESGSTDGSLWPVCVLLSHCRAVSVREQVLVDRPVGFML